MTYRIMIKGTVQGVGFRPFIYQLAMRHSLRGSVYNGVNGVEILLNATTLELAKFLQEVQTEVPPLALIAEIDTQRVTPQSFEDFRIIQTEEGGEITVRIPPDVSICQACEAELFDPQNRRFGYPFITCTQCGVRYTIIEDLPYDRHRTSMRFFEMCTACESEYRNPLDRRYHAQPIGCHQCGPRLSLLDHTGGEVPIPSEKLITEAAKLLAEGNIMAVKGVGGYHLMCDATNETAVRKLRERKQRPSKPFAVMVKDMEMVKELACVNAQEEALLGSKERPIVIVKEKAPLPVGIAPNISKIGLFLPYTPLHLLLLHKLNRPLVATSANVTDEPICTTLASLEMLNGVYDYVLEHNRQIVNGCDDSVLMVVGGQQVILRRARGYAPASVTLPFSLEKHTLAMGANQKSTVAIGFDDQVILSPHIGDLDSIGSVAYYEKNIETLERMYDFKADVLVHDKHPQYESTKYAKRCVGKRTLQEVQHHHAHILGVMAEKQLIGKVFGVAFDGTGYGDDGKLWGGEFMVCDYAGYERVAQLRYFKLLGGDRAIKEPKRVALSLLFELHGEEAIQLENPTVNAFTASQLQTYFIAWKKGLNAPWSSSVGRLFDAVASLLGVCQVMSFEGESGMLLEELYDATVSGYYPFGYEQGVIDILPLCAAIVAEEDITVAVSKFFHTLIEMIATVYTSYSALPLVCSGGVFQNRVLLTLLLERFPDAIIPNDFPPNDGGIALGQITYGVSG